MSKVLRRCDKKGRRVYVVIGVQQRDFSFPSDESVRYSARASIARSSQTRFEV